MFFRRTSGRDLTTLAFTAAAGAVFGALILRRFRHIVAGNVRPARLNPGDAKHRRWMQQMRAFIFDIDGVIHVTGKPIAGAAEALQALRDAGKQVVFMTNNATKTPEDIVSLFQKLGAVAHKHEVMTAAVAAADFLQSQGLQGRSVYVVGMNALADALRERAGVEPFGAEEDSSKTRNDVIQDFQPVLVPPAESVAAVVVGADFGFNYYKLARAANYLRQNPSCLFVATNPDPRALLCLDAIVPAAGSMVAAIAKAAGREPDIVCGKPSESLARHMLVSRGLDPATTCMVGDRTDTDIEFGRSAGMHTLFVESGTMTEKEACTAAPHQRPHFIAASIATLRDLL